MYVQEEILQYATVCVEKMAGVGDNAVKILDSGCVEQVVKGMETFDDNLNVAIAGVRMFGRIAQTGEDSIEKLKKIKFMVKIMAYW